MNEKKVMIVTGEASGDMHGANLIKAMQREVPGISVSGMGGEALLSTGMTPLYDASKLSVVGISEVFSHLADIRAAQQILGQHMSKQKPGLLILIDLPDFNLMLAKKAKKLGIPVFYYISPQVWAWRSSRVKKIKELVDRMAVILPFEKEFYRQKGMNVDFVGHPLLDEVKSKKTREEFLAELSVKDNGQKIIGILPGSRKKEIQSMLQIFIQAAKLIETGIGRTTFLLPVAPTLTDAVMTDCGAEDSGLDLVTTRADRYDLMNACDVVIAASGTVTLELGILNIPMVVSYRVSPLSYFLGSRFIKVEYASLINLIAGKEVVGELLQENATPGNISLAIIDLLKNKEKYLKMKDELAKVISKLGDPGASQRAAKLALSVAMWS